MAGRKRSRRHFSVLLLRYCMASAKDVPPRCARCPPGRRWWAIRSTAAVVVAARAVQAQALKGALHEAFSPPAASSAQYWPIMAGVM